MYIKEVIKKGILTNETLKSFKSTIKNTEKVNQKALNVKNKNGENTNISEEYRKFINSEISFEEFETMYKEFLLNSFSFGDDDVIKIFKSEKEIINELKQKALKEKRFAYVYISKEYKDKFNPNLLKKNIDNIKKDFNVEKIFIKDFKEMPVACGSIQFPTTVIYNANKIENSQSEPPIETVIEGYYL